MQSERRPLCIRACLERAFVKRPFLLHLDAADGALDGTHILPEIISDPLHGIDSGIRRISFDFNGKTVNSVWLYSEPSAFAGISADPYIGISGLIPVFILHYFIHFELAAFIPCAFFREKRSFATIRPAFRVKSRMLHLREISVLNQVLRKSSARAECKSHCQ